MAGSRAKGNQKETYEIYERHLHTKTHLREKSESAEEREFGTEYRW